MKDRPVATAHVTEVVAREPGEPVSPELVLVCPELAWPPVDDSRHRVARGVSATGPALRPPNREVRKIESMDGRAKLHAGHPTPRRVAPPGDGDRDRLHAISTYGFVVVAIVAVAILGWRSLSHSTLAQQNGASPAVHAPAPSAEPVTATPTSSKKGIAPATGTRTARAAPAGAERTATVAIPPPSPPPSPGATKKRAKVETAEQTTKTEEIEPSGLPDTRRPTGLQFAPDAGQRVVSRPQLTWDPIADARGYRLRLYRGKRMLLEVVSHEPKVTLANSWRFAGRQVELTPGTYWWYVWPVPQAAHHPAQRLLKASSFIVVRPAARS